MALFEAAVAAAAPAALVTGRLPAPPAGRTVVVGAGKAAAAMARAVEQAWRGPLSGLVVTPYGHGVACARIEVVEAAHPVPDEAGREAAARIVAQVGGLTAGDLVVCLVSGGGSSLLALPAAGVGLEDERDIGAALLRSGAPIAEINCVRTHLSAIKGGRLAAAAAPSSTRVPPSSTRFVVRPVMIAAAAPNMGPNCMTRWCPRRSESRPKNGLAKSSVA